MRRSRISIKPNVRPGGRAVAPTAENHSSQESAAVDTQQTLKGEQTNRPSPSPQSHLEVIEPAVATGDGNVPDCPSEKASVNTGDREPSSASTPAATALQRRSRISATPNLARPKVRSVPPPSTGKTASLPSVPSKSSPKASVTAAINRDDSQNSTFSDSINEQTTATTNSPSSSPCLPSSSGCHEPSLQKSSGPESSTQPQKELCQTPQKSHSGLHECASPSSSTLSPYLKLSRCDGPGSPLKDSDKQRVLRALKLKELMKLERRKDKKTRKSKRLSLKQSDETDPSKMTLADFIYYLPETNPMMSVPSTEQDSAETIVPPSPKMPIKMAEPEEEEEDDDDDDGEDGLIVPKVKVTEDGTLILDEESLTVRVERTSDTVVENATPLFERGSTTTYMSFRKHCYVKPWSVRETDMFYLAISMVGTDFSMMAQLLTHRNRAEIKSKYKKEEKINAWRVDKAFRNKRPFDQEFFSFLLKRILEQDQKRGKSVKLVVKPNKEKKGKGGKKNKKHADEDVVVDDDIEEELDIGDSAFLDLEKENEDSSNVNVCDKTSSTSKKRKRKRDLESKASPCEKTCKQRKKNKKSKKVEGEESESLHVEDDSVNAENEDSSLKSISKNKRKRSRKSEEKRCEEDLEETRKKKRNKKTVKDLTMHEHGDIDEENVQASMESADTSKTKAEKPAKGKRKTKRSKKCPEDELNTGSSDLSTTGPEAEEDQGEKLTPETAAQEKIPQNSSKRSKRPMPNLAKRKDKKCSETKPPVEDENEPQGQDENCEEDENELEIDNFAESQLQKRVVVVLERTPPRLIKTHGWSQSPDQSQISLSPQGSPGRQTRAESVKRNLTAIESERSEMEKMNECQTGPGSDTSAEEMKTTAMPCQEDTQEYKDTEEDQHIEEDFNQHHQFLTEIKGQMLLKRPAVLVSHEEVDRYLMDQTQMTVENLNISESQLDTASTKVISVEEHVEDTQEYKETEDDQHNEEDFNQHHQFLTEIKGQMLLKRPAVLVSHEEVDRYLMDQTQMTVENLTNSESQLDTASTKVISVEEHVDGQEKCSSVVTLEERVSQHPNMKESASSSSQRFISQKRSRYTKPEPNLRRSQQTFQKPLNIQTAESSDNPDSLCSNHSSSHLQSSSPVEDRVTVLNKLPDHPDKHATSSEVLQVVKDDPQTSIDDDLSFSSDEETPTVSNKVVQEILSFLEKPHLPTTLPDEDVSETEKGPLKIAVTQSCENQEQIADREDYDSDSKIMTEEPQEGLAVSFSCCKPSAKDSVVCPERQSEFAESMPYVERASQIMISSHQTTEHHDDFISEIYDKPGWRSPAKEMHFELGLSMKNISTEDKFVSCEANQQESKQTVDPLCHVQLHESKQTFSPTLPVDYTTTGNNKESDLVVMNSFIPETSEISTDVLSASFSEAPTEYPSHTCNMNTMLFCETPTEDVQRSVNFSEDVNRTDSVQEDSAEDLSKASEDFNAPLKGHAKSEIVDSAGVETGASIQNNQTEEEPTFVLTLYEIPTSQLFHEVSCGHQDIPPPYKLQPAEVHTPLLFSGNSLPSILEDSSAPLQMKSGENEKPCGNVSEKMVDDSSVPVPVVKDDRTGPPGSQEMLSNNDSVPTELKVKPSKSTQRRSKIKVKPTLKPYVKAGLSKAGQSECASIQKTTTSVQFPTSYASAQHTEMESSQTTSVQETAGVSFVLDIVSNPQDSERETCYGYESALSTAFMPVYEDVTDELPMTWETDSEMDMDTVLDLSVTRLSDLHSTATEESKEELEDNREGVSHLLLVDASVLASGEMEDESRPLEGLERPLPHLSSDISKEAETYRGPSSVTSASEKTEPFLGKLQERFEMNPKTTCTKDEYSREDEPDIITLITLEPQIKEESDKVEEKAEQEDFSDYLKEDLDKVLTVTEEVMKTKQQFAPFTTVETSVCAEAQPVEKTEDEDEGVSHVVLPDMLVAVSEEPKDKVHTNSDRSLQQSCEDVCAIERLKSLTTEAHQDTGGHEGVSHMTLPDIFIPVSEENDLEKESIIGGERSSCDAESSQVKEHPNVSNLFCAMSKSTNVGPSVSPKRRTPIKKGMLKVKMNFPKKRSGESVGSVERLSTASTGTLATSTPKQQNIHNLQSEKESNSDKSEILVKNSAPFESKDLLQRSTQTSVIQTFICAGSTSAQSEDTEEAGVSHTVLSDMLVPVSDETAENSLHKADSLVSLQDTPSENALKSQVEESVTEGPSNTERKNLTAIRSAEQNMLSCQRAQSMEPQAEEEWSLISDMLPMDSNEIENWCEGVSHMLLSDAFVPVSEEENSTDPKGFVASGPYEDSPLECRETSDNANKKHQVDDISAMRKLPPSQTKKSPGRQSTLQMTLRSPNKSPKKTSHVLKSIQALPTTPQRAKMSKEVCVQTPTRQQKEETTRECTIQLERLSLEEICQRGWQPKHHSTPVNVKTFSKGNESKKAGLGSRAAQEPAIPSGGWPKVVLNRIEIKGTDVDTSTSSPARVSSTADRPLDEYQSPNSKPHNSGLNTDENPASVSQFFLDDIFTEVMDPD